MGTSAESTALELTGVKAEFTVGGASVIPFQDLSVRVLQGAFWSVIGPSGCGKSTLLRIMSDLLAPAAGTVKVFSGSAAVARANRDIAFVFQEPTLLPWRTVIENVRLPFAVGKQRDKGTVRFTPEDMLELVGLSKWHHALPQELSGGMRQRVAIARALVTRPRLLLMDEPFGALDELIRDELNDELLRIWAETRTTIVFVTHSLTEAAYLSEHILVMRAGQSAVMLKGLNPGPATDASKRRESSEFVALIAELRRLMRG